MFGSSVNVRTARDLHAGGAMLLDVRTKPEWRTGHAPGADHVSMDSVAQRLEWIARRAGDEPVLVICRSGNRSGRVAGMLRRQGVDARNVRGGMIAWQRAGFDVVTR
ncbi:MAG: rhodanese-like domain-containing protein [Acidimicrobiia bacterium]|nr:rhodanese-like domain-containing protein [Acidimicrobiia bacterium]MDH4308713.1 rhodanese-like domain-containing protein [Acidimicrobiia bacterium]MDH5294882.1 rhodanese-like domain-containing protein [Acidimicrobiia bacterium]